MEQVRGSRLWSRFGSRGSGVASESFTATASSDTFAEARRNRRAALRRGTLWALVSLTPALGAGLDLLPRAHAQMQQGQIQGVVTSDADDKPVPGVTVVVSGPALQGDQAEVTGADGRYIVTQLPSGDDYVVRFYLGETIVERPGVRVTQNKTLTISVAMPMKKLTTDAKRDVKVIRERAPNVDTATANSGVEINQDVLRSTAVRGRTFESVLTLAPGTVDPPRGQGGDIGVSISGSTGNENNFLIDGLNTSDPNSGILGTELHQYFIKEINVITGGYQAEYGRATGGVVTMVTKTGSNELHGSVFGSVQPFQLPARTVGRLGEALAIRRTTDGLVWDLGFELGGPIWKDRIWFYVGFAPTSSTFRNERATRRLVLDGSGNPQRLDYECPSYLSSGALCRGGQALALATEELGGYLQRYDETRRLYNGIVKLQFNLSPDHNISLGYIPSPSTYDGYMELSPFRYASVPDFAYTQINQTHDVMARYVGKLFQRKLQLDVMYGFHYQGSEMRPADLTKQTYSYYTDSGNPYNLADFENTPECRAGGRNLCPLTQYDRGGFGQYNITELMRHQVLAAATAYLSALGTHAVKLGFDFEHVSNDNFRAWTGTDLDVSDPSTGHRAYKTSPDGTQLQNFFEYAIRGPNGETLSLDSFRAVTQTRNYALYLRDSWNIGPLPGLVVNAGLRWEAQEIFAVDGSRQIGIYDNVAPRVGAVWDFTRKGLSKLYVNYGRFYQSIPTTINDRQFSNEGVRTGQLTSDCANVALQPGGRPVPVAQAGAGAPCTLTRDNDNLLNGQFGSVMPGLKGQYIDEVVAGFNYDVGFDVVLGIGYIYRGIGNIIEDMSTDGGSFYLIANPGAQATADGIRQIEQDIEQLRATGGSDAAIERAQKRLEAYRSLTIFPRAQRDYHALVLSVSKRLSNRFSVLANYTFSRTIGNYPGTFDATVGENFPNFSSQYDLTDLLANRVGPLPNDRPHNFKLLATYDQPLPHGAHLNFGLTFTAYSGRPINVLGAHAIYGISQVYVLPRGSGGRTPTITQFDLHIGYDQPLGKRMNLTVYADVINLFNQREVTNVDDDYTYASVSPIIGGKVSDLAHLKTQDGTTPILNSNYGQPTAFQAPLYMRFGARLSF